MTPVQESEDVAAGINAESNGKIKTGVYNAKVDDAQRMRLHERWRNGEVQVVCATIGIVLLLRTLERSWPDLGPIPLQRLG